MEQVQPAPGRTDHASRATAQAMGARVCFPVLQVASLSSAARNLSQPLPVSAHVFGIRLHGSQPFRAGARVMAGAAPVRALPSLGQRRARSGARAHLLRPSYAVHPRPPAPARRAQTIYHRDRLGAARPQSSSYPQNRKYHLAEFSNPNQQGGQDNKSLVAMMVVFVAVLFGAQFYHAKMNPPPAPSTARPVAAPQASAQPPPRAARRNRRPASAAAAAKRLRPPCPWCRPARRRRRSSRTSSTGSRSPTAAPRSRAGS